MGPLLLLAAAALLQRGAAAVRDTVPRDNARDTTALGTVVTTATRDPRALAEVPSALSVVGTEAIRRTRAVHLGEALRLVPGVQAGSLYGTEDVRITIRGAGGRGGFGVRGAAVLLDGVPITEPDGQGRLDLLDLGATERLEVLRGPASALYGGAAGGGVLNVIGATGATIPGVGARVMGGTAGTWRTDASWGGVRPAGTGRLDALAHASYTALEGYRDWSRGLNRRGAVRLGWTGASGARVALDGNWGNLDQRIPGALRLAEWEADASGAEPNNVANRYRRREQRWRVGARVSLPDALRGSLDAYAVASGRDNDQAIFQFIRQIQQRWQGGVRHVSRGTLAGGTWRVALAADADRAAGPQTNWRNTGGAPVLGTACLTDATGAPSAACVRQDAALSSLGLAGEAEWGRGAWSISAGTRWDDLRTDIANRLLPARSIDRRFTQVSPKVALAWRGRPGVTWWAGVARGFEVPTAVELATSPDTARGFNDALRPASSWQLEVGRRGTLGDRAVVEAVAFVADVRDEFVSRTVVIPGIAQPRAFFENAAGARRAGVEVAGTLLTTASTQVGLAYAWSDFRFRAFRAGVVNAQFGTDSVDHSGNQLPAVAPHRLTVEGRWRPASGVALAGWVEWASRTWVDNGNTAAGTLYQRTGGAQPTGLAIPFRAAPSIAQLHLSASWRAGAATFFATGDNLLGARWISSISPNATNGRFYFPGPGRTVAVGVALGALRP